MQRTLQLALAALLVLAGGTMALAQEAAPLVVTASRVNTSAPIRDLPIRPGNYRGFPYAIPNKFHDFGQRGNPAPDRPLEFVDPVLDTGLAEGGGGTVLLSFDGVSSLDNIAVAQNVVPPDANGDVGPNHYVQWVNLAARIFDKSGNLLLGPVPGNHFFQGLGGWCEAENDGDPVTLYDHLADRWVVMQFQISVGYDLCVAVSATPDPTGAYHQYEFDFANFPDYPKLGVWPDGYYATTRSFGGGYLGQEAVAFDRVRMLQGLSAQMIRFVIPGGSGIDGFLPADLDGPAPPAGTPGLFVGAPVTTPNQLRIYGLAANWANPGSSTFTLLDTLTPAAYDRTLGNVPQPSPGEGLATLSFTLMHRVQYRNFGNRQVLMLNHTVDAGADRAGIRWYELRNTGGGWGIYQQGTYAPVDAHERWMGSIAMNGSGDIGLGYSISSTSLFPSLRFTGQTADQSGSGLMNVAETEIHAGTGAQFGSFNRWGDYSSLSVDPSDDRTFWFTSEYYQTTSSFNFKTRIAAFQLPGVECEQSLAATVDDDTPAPGQLITFTVTVTNTAASAASLDLWIDATGPRDRRYRLGSGTVPAGATVTRNVSYRHPAAAPAGTYDVDLNIGDFGTDTICDTVNFTFVASASVAGGDVEASADVPPQEDLFTAPPVTVGAELPEGVTLEAAHPNPFRLAATLSFTLPEATDATLAVFDMLGRRVAVLHDGYAEAGRHTAAFDASGLPSGAYLVRLTTEDGATSTQRISLLR